MGGGAIDFEMDSKTKITDRAPATEAASSQACGTRPRHRARAILHPGGRRSLLAGRLGSAQRRHLGRRRPRSLRAKGRRGAASMVADCDQRRRLEILPRAARHAAARDQRPPTNLARRGHHHADGARSRVISRAPRRAKLSTPSSRTCSSIKRPRSTAPSISTSASRPSRSARHASSSRLRTAWTRS